MPWAQPKDVSIKIQNMDTLFRYVHSMNTFTKKYSCIHQIPWGQIKNVSMLSTHWSSSVEISEIFRQNELCMSKLLTIPIKKGQLDPVLKSKIFM